MRAVASRPRASRGIGGALPQLCGGCRGLNYGHDERAHQVISMRQFALGVVTLFCFEGTLSTASAGAVTQHRVMSEANARALIHSLEEIDQRVRNLIQMSRALDADQRDAVHEIDADLRDANMAITQFATLSFLYHDMQCDPDREVIWREIARSTPYATKLLDVDLEAVNSELALLQAPAAVSEGMKIRDILQQARSAMTP
jgi:hypothetical protein